MKEYELITETVAEAQDTSETVDLIMDTMSGKIPIFYRLKSGAEIPYIDTGYVNQKGLNILSNLYHIQERGA